MADIEPRVFSASKMLQHRIKFNSSRISDINVRIQELFRERAEFEKRNADLRAELRAQCEPDGHLPGCSRSERCLGDGLCQLWMSRSASTTCGSCSPWCACMFAGWRRM